MSRDQSITIRIAKETDQRAWDEFVEVHPEASPYHLFAWKEAIEKSYGHLCYYHLAEQKGNIVGVFPLVHLHFPLLVNEITALPFCDVGNCLCEDTSVLNMFLKRALTLGEELNTKKISLRGELPPTDFLTTRFEITVTGKVRMFLDLPASSEMLLSSFKSKLRSQIRKAEKNGILFHWGSLADIEAAYRVFAQNMHSLGSPVHAKKWLRCILEAYGEKAKLGLVTYEKDIVGMGIILCCGKKVAIPWASTLNEFNRLNPNMLLYWNFLKYSTDNCYCRFDFGRSSEGEGTYKFKKQWGAKPKPLVWYSPIDSACEHSHVKRTHPAVKEKISRAWRRIPLPVANMLGPKIRKYLSL